MTYLSATRTELSSCPVVMTPHTIIGGKATKTGFVRVGCLPLAEQRDKSAHFPGTAAAHLDLCAAISKQPEKRSRRCFQHGISGKVRRCVRMSRLRALHLCAVGPGCFSPGSCPHAHWTAAALPRLTRSERLPRARTHADTLKTHTLTHTCTRRRASVLSTPFTHRGGSRNASASHALSEAPAAR